MTSRKPIHYEARQTVQGEERVFTTSKFAYLSPQGDLLGIAGITRDMTDQRMTEEAETRRTRQHLAHQAALVSLAQLEMATTSSRAWRRCSTPPPRRCRSRA